MNDSFDLGKLKNRVDFLTQKLESEFEDLVKGKQVNQYSIIIYGISYLLSDSIIIILELFSIFQ